MHDNAQDSSWFSLVFFMWFACVHAAWMHLCGDWSTNVYKDQRSWASEGARLPLHDGPVATKTHVSEGAEKTCQIWMNWWCFAWAI